MLNLLPKSMIVGNIVDTLKKDPENGVVKLLETAEKNAKTSEAAAMLRQVIGYYQTSPTAKMQIRNLVLNTNRVTLTAFANYVYDAVGAQPIAINFLKLITIDQAASLRPSSTIFPVIALKNMNEASQEVLARLKSAGHIFFTSIAVTRENFEIVTSNEVILSQVKHGVRAIFYRLAVVDMALEAELIKKIHDIRTSRPILVFFMKKDAPTDSASLQYVITEDVNGMAYSIKVDLR